MTVLLNLELQVGEQKETLGVFSRRKDFVLCLRIPWGLIRRDESKAGNSAITFCQELRSKDLMFSLEPGWNETQELCVPGSSRAKCLPNHSPGLCPACF